MVEYSICYLAASGSFYDPLSDQDHPRYGASRGLGPTPHSASDTAAVTLFSPTIAGAKTLGPSSRRQATGLQGGSVCSLERTCCLGQRICLVNICLR